MTTLESKLISDNAQLWDSWQPNLPARPIVDRIKKGLPVRIYGPCAAQSEEQVMAILEVTAGYSDGVRLPDKKPRTRPVTPDGKPVFHGIGHATAMEIYRKVAETHPQLSICVETMSDKDVYTLTAQGILGFNWSGSRTQEQETLQGLGKSGAVTNTAALIKNPLAPDTELYLGMMENWIIGATYSVPLIAIVRGFTPYTLEEKSKWRNIPNIWLIEALRKAFPKLPIILDPSHMVKCPKSPDEEKTRLEQVVELIKQGREAGSTGELVEVRHPDFPSQTDPGENVYELLNRLQQKNLN